MLNGDASKARLAFAACLRPALFAEAHRISQVSQRAKKRGLPQMGTLGAGNHYAEIQARFNGRSQATREAEAQSALPGCRRDFRHVGGQQDGHRPHRPSLRHDSQRKPRPGPPGARRRAGAA